MSLDRAADPLPDLIDESFDEAAFLWRRWEGELASPTRNLDAVWSWTEDRLQGALDGVRVDASAALAIARREMDSPDPDRVLVGAGLLASRTDVPAIETLAEALDAREGPDREPLLRALELLGTKDALRRAAFALRAPGPGRGAAFWRLMAFRRAAPGDEIAPAFSSGSPDEQIEALLAVRRARRLTAERVVLEGLQSADPRVRYTAAESGLCIGLEGALDTAARLAHEAGPSAGASLNLLALFGTPEDHEVVYAALRVPDLQRPAIWALGHIGTARAVEACLAGMRHEGLARASGEAYCWITGADLDRDHLTKAEPSEEVPPFEDEDLDANLVPAPEALWPLPDTEAVRRHWATQRGSFDAGARHIHGRPAGHSTLLDMMETGPMLRRPDLALELRVLTEGRYDVETRAFTATQKSMMAAGRAAMLAGAGS